MGLFGKRKKNVNVVAPTRVPTQVPPRDIPALYPETYISALECVGKPVTEANVDALARLAMNNLGLNATVYFQQSHDERGMAAFKQMLAAEQHVGYAADRIIDFLWSYSKDNHEVLRELAAGIGQHLANVAGKYGDHLPADIWHQE